MATLVNREMWWALVDKIIPCVVVKQDLEDATVTVLLDNGARHKADAYDVRATEEGARERQRQLARQHERELYLAYSFPDVGGLLTDLRSALDRFHEEHSSNE